MLAVETVDTAGIVAFAQEMEIPEGERVDALGLGLWRFASS